MIRNATTDDLALVRELWHAFDAEVPDAEWLFNQVGVGTTVYIV